MNTTRKHRLQILFIAFLLASGAAVLAFAPIRAGLASLSAGEPARPANDLNQSEIVAPAIVSLETAGAKVALIALAPGKPPESAIKAGRAAFAANCAACHLATGEGSPGLIPPLANSDSLPKLTPDEIAHNVLAGRSGPIVVNGTTYNNVMPPMGYLPDKTIANIVTYVLNKWGDVEGQVTDEHVALIRGKS